MATKHVLIALTTVRIADTAPHLPQYQLIEDTSYDVPGEIPEHIAAEAMRLGFAEAEEVEVDEPASNDEGDAFDPETASRDELKAFIKANPELDEVVNLNLGDEKLRAAVIEFIEAGAEADLDEE